MSSPSREHLLGYLLKALSPDEHEQVESELDQNPSLRAEMHRLESCIGQIGLAEKPGQVDPPAGLAARTCRFVPARRPTARGPRRGSWRRCWSATSWPSRGCFCAPHRRSHERRAISTFHCLMSSTALSADSLHCSGKRWAAIMATIWATSTEASC